MLHSLRRFSKDEIAQERFKIIQFYEQFGERATKEAFGADRKLIHVWKKRLRGHDNKLMALIPYSTKPKRIRKMNIDTRIIEFIRQKRQQYPRMGKEKLKPLLDKYCREHRIQSISE